MNGKVKAVTALMLVVLGVAVAWGQEKEGQSVKTPPPPKQSAVYKLDFVIAEVEDGKRVNSRAYTMTVQDRAGSGHVNVSTRVPVLLGGTPGETKPNVQYMDVGLSLDYRVREEESFIILEGGTRIESFAAGTPESNAPSLPVTRRVSVDGQAAVTPGKSTVIGSVDDVNSKKRYEVQVTATKIK